MTTLQNIAEDLLRNDSGEKDIDRALETVRALHKQKSIPYYELLRSKSSGDFRYILVELNDKSNTIIITDQLTQQQYKISDELHNSDGREELRRY